MHAEAFEVAGIGAGERVDGLIGVAHRGELRAVAEPRPQQSPLRGAGVLELVDEEVTEAPALRGAELRVAFHRVRAPRDEVVEVGEAATALLLLVGREHPGHLGRGARGSAPGDGDRALVGVGGDEAGLRPLDLARQLLGGEGGLAAASPDDGDEEADLALEQRGHRLALLGDPSPQLRERDGVEGAGGDALAHAEAGEAAAQLARGLAGEGDRERVGGLEPFLRGHPGDAAREDARLARPRAGQDRQGRGGAGDRVALGGVEAAQEFVDRLGVHGGTVRPAYDTHPLWPAARGG